MSTHSNHIDEEPAGKQARTDHAVEQATQAAQTTREHVAKKIEQTPQNVPAPEQKKHRKDDPESVVKTSGKKPGEYSPQLGQESGSDWQESQQMGQTGHGGVQHP